MLFPYVVAMGIGGITVSISSKFKLCLDTGTKVERLIGSISSPLSILLLFNAPEVGRVLENSWLLFCMRGESKTDDAVSEVLVIGGGNKDEMSGMGMEIIGWCEGTNC